MNRRYFLAATLAFLPFAFIHSNKGMAMSKTQPDQSKAKQKPKDFPVSYSEKEWQQRLTPDQYHILRKEGTERPFSSDLNQEKREGIYKCAACDHPLYSSSHKYESGTGWPSFYQPIHKDAVGESTDYKLIWPRTEVHCANCGGHLGHVFSDGPQPTGLRYCMNGLALRFESNSGNNDG